MAYLNSIFANESLSGHCFLLICKDILNPVVGTNDYDYTGAVDGGVFTHLVQTTSLFMSKHCLFFYFLKIEKLPDG